MQISKARSSINSMTSELRPSARSIFTISCALLISIGCASPTIDHQIAPRIPGEIAGVVRDSSGHVIPGAQLRLEGIDTIPVPPTNDSGTFHVSGVPRGKYTLVVRRIGYRQSRIPITIGTAPVRFVSVSMRIWDECDIGCDSDIVPPSPKAAIAPTTPISACLSPDSGGTDALNRYRWQDTATDAGQMKWLASLNLRRIPANQISLVGAEASAGRRSLRSIESSRTSLERIRCKPCM